MTAPVFAIVNPAAGCGQGRLVWRAAAQRLRQLGVRYEFELTQGPLTATSFVRQAVRAGAETVLVVGGDGTVNEALNGLFLDGVQIRPGVRLALAPAGSSSDFARGLGIPAGAAAVDLLREGRLVEVDVGKAVVAGGGQPLTRYFLNHGDVGIGARIAAGGARLKRLGGGPAFFLSAVRSLLSPSAWDLVLKLDEHEGQALQALTVFIALGPYTGGGMRLAPRAKWDDGQFDVVVVEGMRRTELLLQLPRVYLGTHLSHPRVHWQRARAVSVQAADGPPVEVDGEVLGQGPAEFTLLPRALRVYAPLP